jgi:REP element-mobilizing transposase RayT
MRPERCTSSPGVVAITSSCWERPRSADLLLKVLEQRNRYRFGVVGFVAMPEHVHLLMSEPLMGNVSRAISAVKLGFTRRVLSEKPLLATSARSGAPRGTLGTNRTPANTFG